VAIAETATQHALAYARERRQGYIAGPSAHEPALIVTHPDVKRMLLSMRALTNAARAICYTTRRRDRPGPQRAQRGGAPSRG
jgi:3-(methylsulfanyl)propanoyl-CoA dehydrogenase